MTPPTTVPEQEKPAEARSAWAEVLINFRWPLVFIAFAVVGFLIYFETLKRVDRVGDAVGGLVDSAADRVEAVAQGFMTGNVTETFLSSIPQIDTSGSGLLELAKIEAVETFSRSDERRVLWDTVSLGITISEIKVPVTYRYHLRFDDSWRLVVTDEVCTVYAPEIRPTQPPAIHTEGLEKRVEESWLRFDGADQMSELERSMTPRLRQLAGDPRRLALVRDQGRRTVAEFVRSWLLLEDQWGSDRVRRIQVVFPGEELEEPDALGGPIRLEEG